MSFNNRNVNGDCPCKDCDIHTVTCHVVCQRYNNWKKELEIKKEEDKKRRGSVNTMSDAKKKAIWRKMRYNRQKPRNNHKEG